MTYGRQAVSAIGLTLLMMPVWATLPCPMGMRSANWWWGGPVLASLAFGAFVSVMLVCY